ncbi:MAG: restriction endonuclease [Anaerolineales bacterium]|nr:restriction endonuclease [Anaerolineales bacterium]
MRRSVASTLLPFSTPQISRVDFAQLASKHGRLLSSALAARNTTLSVPLIHVKVSALEIAYDQPRNPQNLLAPISATISENLIASTTFISSNLFNALGKAHLQGRTYGEKEEEHDFDFEISAPVDKSPLSEDQIELLALPIEIETKPPNKQKNFFELLYPLLLPPLDFSKENIPVLPFNLHGYQITGIEQLTANKGFLLADEMGTGKTVMATVAIKVLVQRGEIRSGIIACPVSVLKVWEEHLKDWAPEVRVQVISGTQGERAFQWRMPVHIFVVSYDTLHRDTISGLLPGGENPKVDLILLDEAQAIKNTGSKRNQAVRKISGKYRWALTGTPVENRIEDILAIFSFLLPNQFPRRTRNLLDESTVKNLIAPYMLRRLKKDVLKGELPPKESQEIWLEMDPIQKNAYNKVLAQEQQAIMRQGKQVTKFHLLQAMAKLKQICNFAPEQLSSPKTEALLDILEEILASNSKILVFSQYLENGIDKIADLLAKRNIEFSMLTGKMSKTVRQQNIDSFQKNPTNKIFLISVRAGGTGLTLTEASYVVHFDQWWNPAVSRQAEDRSHRKGQESTVNVYEFWMSDTIEGNVYRKLQEKGLLAQRVVDDLATDDLGKQLTQEEMLTLLGLTQSESGEIHAFDQEHTLANPATHATKTLSSIRTRLFALSPSEFEKKVEEVIKHMGYPNTEHTGKTSDGGVDVHAWRNAEHGGVEHLWAQCKRYVNNVGVTEARSLFGVVESKGPNHSGILVTSSDFTPQCRRFAAGCKGRLHLLSGLELAREIQRYGITV